MYYFESYAIINIKGAFHFRILHFALIRRGLVNEQIIFWIVVAVILAVIEGVTYNLITIWFCIGAVLAAITAKFTGSLTAQWSVFVISAAVLFALTKPFVKNRLKMRNVPTNADRIIGAEAVVTEATDPVTGAGRINVMGQSWAAKCPEAVPEGAVVKVVSIEGVKAIIKKEEE